MLKASEYPCVTVHSVSEIEKYAAWVLGMVAAVAVLFQAHVSLPGGVINLNLADPFAILTLAAVGLHVLHAGESPVWRIKQFNHALLAISLILLLGFMRGWLEIGLTQWALVGRLLGWFVLLGYLSAGYLIVAHVGTHGLRRFAETLLSTVVVVVTLQAILRLSDYWGINTGAQLTPTFQGYAGNRNAFAFQLLVGVALLLGYSQTYARCSSSLQNPVRLRAYSLLLGITLAGLVWTGSRAGLLTGAIMLILAWRGCLASRRMLGGGLIFAIVLWFGFWLAAQKDIIEGVLSGNLFNLNFQIRDSPVQTFYNGDISNQIHMTTVIHGLDLWQQSPVLGAGLGVFYVLSPVWIGYPEVIHNTPLWILAEFGLLGAAVFGWGFFLLARHAARFGKAQPARRVLLFLLVAFAIFGLAHEIFYQRIFWLVLGAVMAQPYTARLQV